MIFPKICEVLLNKYTIIVFLILILNYLVMQRIVNKTCGARKDTYANTKSNDSDNSDNYNDSNNTGNSKNKVVLYYATWCGWSKKFLPVWEDFKKQNTNKNVTLDAIECDDDNDKCARLSGFPTVIFHKANGEDVEFDGKRTVENLITFVNKNA
jgi:thiol-disulfide isomerase/thioredoxin